MACMRPGAGDKSGGVSVKSGDHWAPNELAARRSLLKHSSHVGGCKRKKMGLRSKGNDKFSMQVRFAEYHIVCVSLPGRIKLCHGCAAAPPPSGGAAIGNSGNSGCFTKTNQ